MLSIDGKKYEWKYFPNGEIKFPDPDLVRFSSKEVIPIKWIFESNEEFVVLQVLVKHLREQGFTRIYLDMPFCPYGQQDRPVKGQLFSFKYFAQILNDMEFEHVSFYDPHSLVMDCAIRHSQIQYLSLTKTLLDTLGYDLVLYPDNGAAKKYSEIYPDLPYRFGNKKRNLDTGAIIRYEVIAEPDDIKGKAVLIVDDLCMGGTTFREAAAALKDMGAVTVGLVITHLMPQSLDFIKQAHTYGINQIFTYGEGVSSLVISKLTPEESKNIITFTHWGC